MAAASWKAIFSSSDSRMLKVVVFMAILYTQTGYDFKILVDLYTQMVYNLARLGSLANE